MERTVMLFLLFFLFIFLKITIAVELQTISNSQFLTDGDTLVSQTGVFKLGFFHPAAGKSNNRYLGILYNKIATQTVVWVANRNDPITGSSSPVLKIDYPGILVLSSNITIIWSSNTTKTSTNVTAKLHDTGNLVLFDRNKNVVWQSFDYPTDTLLPGMKLGSDFSRGIEWRLWSWRNNEHPSVGDFTWGPDTHHYPESKLKHGATIKFQGGPWKNQRITGVSQFDKNLVILYTVVVNKTEVSFSYSNNINSSMAARVALNSSGLLESSVWVEEGKRWLLALSLLMDVCDTYNICSGYGICSLNRVQQSCSCLDEKRFAPRNVRSWEAVLA